MKDATALRGVSEELRSVTATFQWRDNSTRIPGKHIHRWNDYFPEARAACFFNTAIPPVAFECLRDLETLRLLNSRFSMGAFFATRFHRLTTLHLSEIKLGCEVLDGMYGFKCPHLTNLEIWHCYGLTNFFACFDSFPRLKSLRFDLLLFLNRKTEKPIDRG
jgi:hypothetical protein